MSGTRGPSARPRRRLNSPGAQVSPGSEVDPVFETGGAASLGGGPPVSMSAPIIVSAAAGATPLLFESSICIALLTVVPVGMWAKVSISPPSELAREAGEAQPVGNADRSHIHRPSW